MNLGQTTPLGAETERPCRECAQAIPVKAKRCTHDNCGAYQDWRRFLGTQPNFITVGTFLGIVVTIAFNLYQIRDLSHKADKNDVNDIKETVQNAIPRVKKEVSAIESQLLAIPDEFTNRYTQFLKLSGTGLTKVLPRGLHDDVLPTRGGDAYYSFSSRTYDYDHGADIELDNHTFRVGFAGADYGFFVVLGNIPIQDVQPNPAVPNWLDSSQHNAWIDIWRYQPPQETAKLRLDSRRGTSSVQVQESTTYLVRSINVRRSDTLTAFRVEKIFNDGSVILVWRTLASFTPPAGTGADLQQ